MGDVEEEQRYKEKVGRAMRGAQRAMTEAGIDPAVSTLLLMDVVKQATMAGMVFSRSSNTELTTVLQRVFKRMRAEVKPGWMTKHHGLLIAAFGEEAVAAAERWAQELGIERLTSAYTDLVRPLHERFQVVFREELDETLADLEEKGVG